MNKYLRVITCAALFAAVTIFVSCGGSSSGDGDGGGNADSSLAGTWKWVSSTWSGAAGFTITYTDAQLEAWGASLKINIKTKSDGTVTATITADDVTGGDVDEALVGTWTSDAHSITITTGDGMIIMPYTLSGNTLTVTVTSDQLLTITGESMPVAYSYLNNATADAVLKKQ